MQQTTVALTRSELKKLKSLLTRKGRRAHGLFLAEGVRLLEAALALGARPETVYFGSDPRNGRGADTLAALRGAGVACRELPSHQLDAIASTETPQGLVAVFTCPDTTLPTDGQFPMTRLLVCDGVSDPGNVGTLIRSAVAFDFDLVVLTGASADPFSPKVVRATVGALFGIRVARASTGELVRFLRDGRFQLVATTGSGTSERERLRTASAAERLALAVGSEHQGLSREILHQSDLKWRVAHERRVESLNAAVAGSIVMKDLYDARRDPNAGQTPASESPHGKIATDTALPYNPDS